MHTVEEIAALLHIHRNAHEIGGLANISNSALNRLRMINDEMGVHGFGSEPPKVEEPEVKPEEPPVIDRRELGGEPEVETEHEEEPVDGE